MPQEVKSGASTRFASGSVSFVPASTKVSSTWWPSSAAKPPQRPSGSSFRYFWRARFASLAMCSVSPPSEMTRPRVTGAR